MMNGQENIKKLWSYFGRVRIIAKSDC